MKISHYSCLLWALLIAVSINAQEGILTDITYRIDVIDPPLAQDRSQLISATTIADLNGYYKPEWIKEFKSVKVITSYEGKRRVAFGTDDVLTDEQRSHIETADDASNIEVTIDYLPNNNLSHNDLKEINFVVPMNPDIDAIYPQDSSKLSQYLKDVIVDYIPEGLYKQFQLSVVTFVVDEYGRIINPKILSTSNDEELDSLMIEGLCNMEIWQPAQYKGGLRVSQEFALNIGNMESCVANLVNIRGRRPPE